MCESRSNGKGNGTNLRKPEQWQKEWRKFAKAGTTVKNGANVLKERR